MIKFGRFGDSRGDMPALARVAEFDQLYDEHVDFVWRNLRRLGVPEMSIEDAVQDVFLVLHRKLASFEGRSSIRTWIYAVSRRVAFRHRRSQSRAQRKLEALGHLPREQAALEHRVVLREAARILEEFLDELDELKREAFVLGALEGFTRIELGAALGVSPNTAYSRLRAAREAFEARFGPSGSDPAAALLDGARLADTPVPSERDRVRHAVFAMLPQAAAATAGFGTKLAIAALVVAATGTIAVASTGGTEAESGSRRAGRPLPERAAADVATAPATEPGQADGPVFDASDASEPAPSSPRPVRAPRTTEANVPAPKPTRSSASALEEETALMERVRKVLARREFETALDLLDAHERQFANGALALERKASRVIALCGLGREAQAHGEGRKFLAEHSGHPLAGVVTRTCRSIDFSSSGDQPER